MCRERTLGKVVNFGYEGISLSTSALSVYRGSEKYQCAEEEAYEGSAQVIDLPDTLLYTGVTYVAFLSLPTYVVGGNVAMRLYSGNQLLFNITTSLHLHRYLGAHEIVWLEAAHERDEVTRIYNPHLPPPQKHAHGVREEDCRFPAGCPYRLRAGMQSLILTSTAFKIDTPVVLTEEQRQREEHARASAEMYQEVDADDQHHHLEVASSVVQPQKRTFAQDESMLIYATGLKLVVDYAEVVESNELATRANAHVPGVDQPHVYDPDGRHERRSPMTFIAPDILLSFHQYELSPMQHVGVAYIIRGSILLLAAIAIAYVKYSNDQARTIKQR